MDAVEFIKERNRMCNSSPSCTGCPASGMRCNRIDSMSTYSATELVSVVEKWSREYPRKTRQSEFLEQWPNAHKDRDGVVYFDPCLFDETIRTDECEHKNCYKCRHEFWTQEVK